MVEEIVASLEEAGALSPSKVVLDLACGTGTYALRFAPRVKEVWALDISPKMLEKLEEKRRAAGLENIRLVQADWREYTPPRTFDTVFVSLTPLLNDLSQVDRILKVTKRFLGLVQWAGLRENELYQKLLEELFKRSPRKRSPGAVILFNYLFSRGYPAEVRFFSGVWERRRPLEKEYRRFLFKLQGEGLSLSEEDRDRVRAFLERQAQGGEVRSRTKVRIAFLLADFLREPLAFA